MFKRILKIWFIIGMYELSKYVTNKYIVREESDMVSDFPTDYEITKWR